ncbi:MAG: sigma 54-interacting transcriptional regulator [Proteobacteria bacterium]|nr:sigma 54-interacting transcriptional regulator [Pseudomonadota bacterium]
MTAMEIIASDTDPSVARMLDGFEYPAILVTTDYRILATNNHYREIFGAIPVSEAAHCYQVSHGYEVPCDQAGEDCPLAAATASGHKERVLHIHQTPRGPEHVDVEMLPIMDESGKLKFFVELLKPLPVASKAATDHSLIGASPAFNKMLGLISRVGPTSAAVLLLGESGTGKELTAGAIHNASVRADKSLVTLECAGLNEMLFESELFGHVKGAFTGANYTKQGLIESADGGTLFLDEIGDIPYPLQVKLLRLIETGTYRPVGSTEVKKSDFRLICATHKDLFRMVEDGEFRQDLYYRINVFPIHIPSLGERKEDIPLLAELMLRRKEDSQSHYLTETALALLKEHRYQGNIRELRNILHRAVILADASVIEEAVIRECLNPDAGPRGEPLQVDLKTLEDNYLQKLLKLHGGDKTRVAEIAGISVRSLYRKLQEESDTDTPA